MTEQFVVTQTLVDKILNTVDAGLIAGLGQPIPGQMCVEAAVCFAMGLPHDDKPTCVAPSLRAFKIGLNDANWSSDKARAQGLRRLAIAQLGTADTLDGIEFAKRLSLMIINKILPIILRDKFPEHAKACDIAKTLDAAYAAAKAAYAAAKAAYAADAAKAVAYAAAYAYADAAKAVAYAADAYAADAYAYADAAAYAADAYAAAYAYATDAVLKTTAEHVVEILIDMKTPGSLFL